MSSLDFELEKNKFSELYDTNYHLLEDAKNSFVALINALVTHSGSVAVAKVEGRVKDKEECIRKFSLKYRSNLEGNGQPYSIENHITDLIGIRVVCLYEDEIDKVGSVLANHFDFIEVTNKIAQIENTEGSFGYKGLHLDLKLGESRRSLPEYAAYANFSFEIQIRTIIQDSWSVLDHKIKYKKSIPNRLKRRINTLAALFELADREFREIRDSTEEEIRRTEAEPEESTQEPNGGTQQAADASLGSVRLNVFGFLKTARHFFNAYDFQPHKVDGFAHEIVALEPAITRGKFNLYMRENISKVKRYQTYFEETNPNDTLNPFTIIRHCLYLGNKTIFAAILSKRAKESFETWLAENNGQHVLSAEQTK
jgi:putative GTP pyrophosphokinase